MKIKVDIELWDNSPMEQLEEIGLTEKFLQICYQKAFEQLVEEMREGNLEYSVNVKVEDNTVE